MTLFEEVSGIAACRGDLADDAISSLNRHLNDVIPPLYRQRKPKVYISGPMTGIPEENRPEFERMEKLLDGMGVNPHKLDHNHGKTREEYMRVDLKALLCCDAILLLDGWERSHGALVELDTAIAAGITVYRTVEEIKQNYT